MIPAGQWSVVYADGSANQYVIEGSADGASFVYDPVTPEQSSTGTYSGGDPRSGPLDRVRVAELWRQVRAFEADTEQHAPDRNKGTGAFSIRDANGKRSFIVERTPALLAFDTYLKTWS
jgi:hypothetical protein